MANENYFGDGEYIKNLIFFDKADASDKSLFEKECKEHTLLKDKDSVYHKRAKKAFELAHEIRKFEIELFWKRGTYYWAYIIGTYAAYFAVLSKVIDGCNKLSLATLISLPTLTKIVLCVISFLCFFFCLSWVLMNKGSKFWQENWEAHIDNLEDEFSGKLYKIILNTYTNDFRSCLLSKESYDYSVTKVTMLGSIVLMIVSFALFLFHIVLLFPCAQSIYYRLDGINSCTCGVLFFIFKIIFIAILLFFIFFKFLAKCKGNTDNNSENLQSKWHQRKK